MRDWLTNVLRSVDVLGPVGRAEPPQPLRDVSISMPMLDVEALRHQLVPERLRERQLVDVEVPVDPTRLPHRLPFTVVLMVKYGSRSAE